MIRTRLTAVTLLAVGIAVWGACAAKQQNGMECLKNADCESDRCIQYICVDPNASRPGLTPGGDTGTPPVDAAADGDTAPPPDTAMAETAADTMMAAETAADTSGD